VAASLVISAAVYAYFRSVPAAAASFVTGVFLDIDHILDYFINYGIKFDVRDFYDCCMQVKFDRLSLIFHSYELIALFWAAIFLFSLGSLWKGMAIGATQHIIFDQLFNRPPYSLRRRRYFLIFRLINKFHKRGVVKE
jgi:hypothetical protein